MISLVNSITFMQEITPTLPKLLQKIKDESIPPNSFSVASSTLNLKCAKVSPKKKFRDSHRS
jgi:hypothetical protein